jgi:uncharacterized protein YqgC (DUF456 family)
MAMEHILLFAGMLLGLAVIPFGLPGALIILVSVLVYAMATSFAADIGVSLFVGLCILTAVAETADNWLTALGARRYGASSVSVWLSFLGGLAGAILVGGPLAVLVGPFAPIAGGCAGAFLIVVVYERAHGKTGREALRAGWGTFVGRMAGLVLKLVIAVAMIITVAAKILL